MIFHFFLAVFSKRNRNIFCVFLSGNKNTGESLGEVIKPAKTLAFCSRSCNISRSPKLSLVFPSLDRHTENVVSF